MAIKLFKLKPQSYYILSIKQHGLLKIILTKSLRTLKKIKFQPFKIIETIKNRPSLIEKDGFHNISLKN